MWTMIANKKKDMKRGSRHPIICSKFSNIRKELLRILSAIQDLQKCSIDRNHWITANHANSSY